MNITGLDRYFDEKEYRKQKIILLEMSKKVLQRNMVLVYIKLRIVIF